MRPHLVRDVRLLSWAFGYGHARPAAEIPELLGPVIERASALAAETLGGLCRELAGSVPEQPGLPRLEIFRSPIAAASAPIGVRALGPVSAGRLLCFYPGRVFQPDEPRLPVSDKILSNEYEAIYYDGAGWLPMQLKSHPLLAGYERAMWHSNRLAVGNLVNHPPAGVLPNVVPIAVRWPTWQELGEASPAFWARLLPYIAVWDGKVVRTASGEAAAPGGESKATAPGSESKVWFPPWPHTGLAFVAIRALQPGDELFFNYRMHARSDAKGSVNFPDWYHPVDEDAVEADIAGTLG